LTSLVYNIGPGNFAEKPSPNNQNVMIPTDLISALKAGDLVRAGEEWLDFDTAIVTDEDGSNPRREILRGLVNRRWEEVVNLLGEQIGELRPENVKPEYWERLPGRGP